MKRKTLFTSIAVACSSLLFLCFYYGYLPHGKETQNLEFYGEFSEGSYKRPILQKEGSDQKKVRKLREWTSDEVLYFKNTYDAVRNSLKLYEEEKGRPVVTPVNNYLAGEWESSGPFNMPGAFQFCEMDEGTDTVYAVTCGHYGGTQFIWKGTLTDDEWTMINPKHPSRFTDLIVLPKGSKRRVIASHNNSYIMYSDNGGETWETSSGLSRGIKSLIVNRQDNNTLYATDGNSVYFSNNLGTSFTKLQDITAFSYDSRLYSPRWDSQPGASEVYLAIDESFYKLKATKTEFEKVGTIPAGAHIGIGGDTRGLWVTRNGNRWHLSTDEGKTWTYKYTEGNWYSTVEEGMPVGHYPGISPEDPNILIGGYAIPLVTKDAGKTTNHDAQYFWGNYQGSVGNDPKVRTNYHPDFQASQFFYDKNGKLITLRSSDGGVFVSDNEWKKSGYATLNDIKDVYYNITLFGVPSQETYRGAFAYGYKDINHLTVGTQDQGWQNTRENSFGDDMLSWDQVIGGDGPNILTGDGKVAWEYDAFGRGGKRRELYLGEEFKGITGPDSERFEDPDWSKDYYWVPAMVDKTNADRIWMFCKTLRRMEYNTSTQKITGLEHDLTKNNTYVQALAQSKQSPEKLYCLQDGHVFKTTNTGDDWTEISGQSATGITSRYENKGMGWSSPIDDDIILFATESGTDVKSILSVDGGKTWKDVTGSGANLFPSAQVNGMAGNEAGTLVFASTNMGPYVFVVSKQKWYPMATDPSVPIFWGQNVYCLKYGDKEIVRFATWGQGIWDFTIDYDYVPPHTTAKLGVDQVLCGKESILLSANIPADGQKTFTWYKDGNIVAAASLTKNTLEVTSLGEYICELDSAGLWQTQDVINITSLPTLNLGSDKHLCTSSSLVLSTDLPDTFISNTWYRDGVELDGENSYELTVTRPGVYRCLIAADGCSNQEDEIVITSDLLDVEDVVRCDEGVVDLEVNASTGVFKWFDAPVDGTELYEGYIYSPSITATTTYYLEDASAVAESFGPSSVDDYSNKQLTWDGVKTDKIKFEVHSNIVLNSVDIFSSDATKATCNVYSSDKITVVKSVSITPGSGKNTITLDVELTPGTYYMDAEGTAGQIYFNGDQSNIPSYSSFDLSGKISFTGTEPSWVENNKRWMIFYNWQATQGKACSRTIVKGVVDPMSSGCAILNINGTKNSTLTKVEVTAYPNPAVSELNVSANNFSNDPVTIELLDIQGHRVYTVDVNSKSNKKQTIDVSKLPKGTYLLKSTTNDKSEVQKIVIQ